MAEDNGSGLRAERKRTRPTMTDVARIAGVSQSSVSLVLNEMTGARISAETRQRVAEAARQIGYALPAIRREAHGGSERRTIAYLVDEISTSPHPVINLDGARDFAFEQDFLVAAHVTRSNPELEEATIAAIKRDKSVIGVIYSTIFTRRVTLPSCAGRHADRAAQLLRRAAQAYLDRARRGRRRFRRDRAPHRARPPPHRLHQRRAVDGRLGRPAERLPAGAGHRRHRLRRDAGAQRRLAAAHRLPPRLRPAGAARPAERHLLRQRPDGDRRAWRRSASSGSRCRRTFR